MSFNNGDNLVSNTLFANIARMDEAERVEQDTRWKGYTNRINANSDAVHYHPTNRKYYQQLQNNGINNRDSSLIQNKGFKDDYINASFRGQTPSSRFNYAFDRQINKRYINVSGQFIPNENLRVLPNRGGIISYGKIPDVELTANDKRIQLLGEQLYKGTIGKRDPYYDPTKQVGNLKFNINKERLTKQDLINSSSQYSKPIKKASQQDEIQQVLRNLDTAWV